MTEKFARVTSKVYSILNWIIGGMYIISALFFMIFSKQLSTQFEGIVISVGAFVAIGVLLLILGLFDIIVAIGIWRLKNWARIVTLVVLALTFIMMLIGIIDGNSIGWMLIFNIIVMAFVLAFFCFFAFNKDVKKIFTNVFKKKGL
jgi:hypothetical protein